MVRTKYFHTDEVAELLKCSKDEVYALLKEGKVKGHKNKRGWLIDMEQPSLSKYKKTTPDIKQSQESQEIVEDNVLQYVEDSEHADVLLKRINSVTKSLFIACADFKYLHFRERSILDILNDVAKKGVRIEVISSSPKERIVDDLEFYHYLSQPQCFEHMICVRNHMKMFIFDKKEVYIGSANLTNAAIGYRSKEKRNFEAGIITNNKSIVEKSIQHFNKIWNESVCENCISKLCKFR